MSNKETTSPETNAEVSGQADPLVVRMRKHCAQMAPHIQTRETAILLRAAIEQIDDMTEALVRCRHQASYSIGDSDALSNQLAKVRKIANEALGH